MYSFRNDYSEGAHPQILQKLLQTNDAQQAGYGEDAYSIEAKALLREKMNHAEAKIYFVSGGTQANLIVIAALLRPHEAVVSAQTGHIFVHETGAIESIGHRVIAVQTTDGKLSPLHLQQVVEEYSLRPHVVKPKMVYLSNSTETGTIYTRAELAELSALCKTKGLYLYLDGARLGHALTAIDNDLTLADIAQLTDAFYIGGTKNGALLGEAIVFNTVELAADFDYLLKQKGALLAKGRVLGVQFLELFRDDLYFTLARHANTMAQKMVDAIKSLGYSFLTPTTTNQIFPILPHGVLNRLEENYLFYVWKKVDADHSAIRLITSWTTDEAVVNAFIEDLEKGADLHR
jgi:threonine aldolase